MRIALASLIFVAGVAGTVQAQTPPVAAPAQTPAAPAAAPAAPATTTTTTAGPAGPTTTTTTTAPAAPVTTTTPTPVPATPAPATPAPADQAAATPPAAEAAPTLPTTGDGAVVISIVEKICVPLVRGGDLTALAKAQGMKLNRRDQTWTMPLGGDKTYTLTVFAPGVNKDACEGELHYALGQDKPIVSALNVWSFLHQPELILQANYVAVDPDGVKRVRKSWEHLEANSSTAINFSTLTKPDDTPLNSRFATARFTYQERHF